MDPGVPLVVSQVNPDDLAWHEGIIANPNCSTMQLAPVLMALRDSVGIERVVVDTYQSVSGTGADAIAELEGQIQAHVDGGRRSSRRLPAPDRVQRAARDRRLPRQRLHEGGVEGRHREPQDPPPAGPPDLVHGRPRPGLRQPLRGGPRRDARPDHAGSRARAVRGRPRRRRPGRPVDARRTRSRPRPPGRDEIFVGRVRQDPSIAGRSRASRSGSSPTTCARARPRTPSRSPSCCRARAGSARRGPWRRRSTPGRGAPRPRRDRCRAPRGARGDRRGGPGLHAAAGSRDPDQGRARARAIPTPRSCSSARARARTRTARAGRSWAGPATCS